MVHLEHCEPSLMSKNSYFLRTASQNLGLHLVRAQHAKMRNLARAPPQQQRRGRRRRRPGRPRQPAPRTVPRIVPRIVPRDRASDRAYAYSYACARA